MSRGYGYLEKVHSSAGSFWRQEGHSPLESHVALQHAQQEQHSVSYMVLLPAHPQHFLFTPAGRARGDGAWP